MQRMHTRRKIVILAVILAVFVILAAVVYFSLRRDIRFRMFRAMEHFSTESVNSPEYLLYDLDVTGLCRNYLNGDISVDGTIGLSRTEQLNIPLSVDIQGTRSVTQGRMHLEAGIRIIAQPPGKKLQNMMQLSGGEKALTAIALLFAIQALKPSPFCLLDEIEAALDDSNVTRFANYLNKLTKNTQFIVITHRRGTMAAADRLYGITMQEKGVSTLVSVNLIENDLDE